MHALMLDMDILFTKDLSLALCLCMHALMPDMDTLFTKDLSLALCLSKANSYV